MSDRDPNDHPDRPADAADSDVNPSSKSGRTWRIERFVRGGYASESDGGYCGRPRTGGSPGRAG